LQDIKNNDSDTASIVILSIKNLKAIREAGRQNRMTAVTICFISMHIDKHINSTALLNINVNIIASEIWPTC
jgi:hypothetical protein